MSDDTDCLAFFRDLETSLHRRSVRNSPDAVASLLTDDFVEFGRSGRVYDKQRIIEALVHEDAAASDPPTVRDFNVRFLCETVALATYRTIRKRPDSMLETLRCSIWRLDGNDWRMAFHQGTPTAHTN